MGIKWNNSWKSDNLSKMITQTLKTQALPPLVFVHLKYDCMPCVERA